MCQLIQYTTFGYTLCLFYELPSCRHNLLSFSCLWMKARFHMPSYRFQEAQKHLSAKKIIFSCGSNDKSEVN